MTYDWLAQSYASGPAMTKEGKRHRAKYLRHWAKRMKPEDPVDTAHIEALAEEEEREKARIAAEKLAIDAARKARDAEESEWEEVPYKEWKVGDQIERMAEHPHGSFVPGAKYTILSKLPTNSGKDGVLIAGVDSADSDNGWSAMFFRLRRRKNKGFQWKPEMAKIGNVITLDNGDRETITNVHATYFCGTRHAFDMDGKARLANCVIATIVNCEEPKP